MTTPDQRTGATRDDLRGADDPSRPDSTRPDVPRPDSIQPGSTRPDSIRHDDVDGAPRTTDETGGPVVYGSDPAQIPAVTRTGTGTDTGTGTGTGITGMGPTDAGDRDTIRRDTASDLDSDTPRHAATTDDTRVDSTTTARDADADDEPVAGTAHDTEAGIATSASGTTASNGTPDATPATSNGAPTSTGEPELARLVSAEKAESYSSRWNEVKGTFVDEPRHAVAQADALVGELLDELEQLFRDQRSNLEHGLDADETSTEDLRLALRRYRSFFDRLLSI